MTADEVLMMAQDRGVAIRAVETGQLRWQSPEPLPDDLRLLLIAHKEALVAILPPPWDQSTADQLMSDVHDAVSRAEEAHEAGRMTATRLKVIRLWLEVCDGYAHEHEAEAGRGWDAMSLLKAAAGRAMAAAQVDLQTETTFAGHWNRATTNKPLKAKKAKPATALPLMRGLFDDGEGSDAERAPCH